MSAANGPDAHASDDMIPVAGRASALGEIAEVRSGPVAGGRAVYVRNPNDTVIELYEPPAARTTSRAST